MKGTPFASASGAGFSFNLGGLVNLFGPRGDFC